MTDVPGKGERQCVCWPMSSGDETIAMGRAMGDPNRASDEFAKQMIRVIDGKPVDVEGSGQGENLEIFWNEIGKRCRAWVVRIYSQLHYASPAETEDFLEHCIAVRSASAG